ncbi:hypothetical protein L198_03631 [Cryptococcus wingfieldii CBS 7118]|uniref:Bola-like protein n=1 Tax=Cryptococcus wingfieldii CBS 7118 TaxID=1295528 RepID=A0A1E3JC08_9TREE|nr:hypothetical protein L198_03631 [Cryptococcus wingfieldii CBS 7118]ODN98387.1 hypothetical protein L198_03631 [Cryptococcus wingfieldii CBS 7118]
MPRSLLATYRLVTRSTLSLPRFAPALVSPRNISAARVQGIRRYTASTESGEQVIYDKLKAQFPGSRLEVQDVSGGCGSFYAILISSPAFKGLSTVKQHKLVNECLKEDIKGIHGLQLKTIPE